MCDFMSILCHFREQEDESSAICFEQVPFCVSGASHSVIRPDGTHTGKSTD